MSNAPISPKVKVPFVVGLFASSVLTNISFVTPDMLHALGPWAPFAIGTLTAVLGAVVGYKVNDPLRVTPVPDASNTDTAAVEDSKQTSVAATAVNAPAPATTFPKAAVDAAEAAAPAAPAEVTPVYTPPTETPAPVA